MKKKSLMVHVMKTATQLQESCNENPASGLSGSDQVSMKTRTQVRIPRTSRVFRRKNSGPQNWFVILRSGAWNASIRPECWRPQVGEPYGESIYLRFILLEVAQFVFVSGVVQIVMLSGHLWCDWGICFHSNAHLLNHQHSYHSCACLCWPSKRDAVTFFKGEVALL